MSTRVLASLRRRKGFLSALVGAIVAGGVVAGVSVATSSTPSSKTTAAAVPAGLRLQGAIVNVVQSVSPSVVQIQDQTGLGSGIVFDAAGDIPTLAATDPELGGSAAPGIGFAIPSNLVKDIAGQIVANGKVVDSHRAYLGIRVGDTNGSGVKPQNGTKTTLQVTLGTYPGS